LNSSPEEQDQNAGNSRGGKEDLNLASGLAMKDWRVIAIAISHHLNGFFKIS
jgi:hypothetical protein